MTNNQLLLLIAGIAVILTLAVFLFRANAPAPSMNTINPAKVAVDKYSDGVIFRFDDEGKETISTWSYAQSKLNITGCMISERCSVVYDKDVIEARNEAKKEAEEEEATKEEASADE